MRVAALRRPWFPLLVKELREQASRKRTYVVRLVYALILFGAFCVVLQSRFAATSGVGIGVLGVGGEFLAFLVYVQLAGIFILLPAMMSGVLTQEKERGSLALLLTTTMRPSEIVLQKYFSRLVPMVAFLLLSLPLLAVSYAFGGVSADQVTGCSLSLLCTCLFVGSMSVMLSSYCRTTPAAFIWSYVAAVLLRALPMGAVAAAIAGSTRRSMGQISVMLFLTAVCLALAIKSLRPRAFVTPRHRLLAAFRRIDAFFKEANSIVGNVELVRDRGTLPRSQPVAWRECQKKTLGKINYLFRFMVILEAPTLVAALGFLTPYRVGFTQLAGLSGLALVLWVLAGLAVSARASDVVVAERSDQTLDVLLATPLAGRAILRQKMRSVWRLVLVFVVPLCSVFAIEAWWEGVLVSLQRVELAELFRPDLLQAASYVWASLGSVLIYLPMFAWVSLWIGLRARTRTRAILAAVIVIVAWNALPWLASDLAGMLVPRWSGSASDLYLRLLSPTGLVVLNEQAAFMLAFRQSPVTPTLLAVGWHLAILLVVRHLCLRSADQRLGRIPDRRSHRARAVPTAAVLEIEP